MLDQEGGGNISIDFHWSWFHFLNLFPTNNCSSISELTSLFMSISFNMNSCFFLVYHSKSFDMLGLQKRMLQLHLNYPNQDWYNFESILLETAHT